jgi:hypothetical protein
MNVPEYRSYLRFTAQALDGLWVRLAADSAAGELLSTVKFEISFRRPIDFLPKALYTCLVSLLNLQRFRA